MRGMFAGCPYFTGKEIENWDVSRLSNARGMFFECENFDADLTVFDENIDVKMTIIGGKIVYNNL